MNNAIFSVPRILSILGVLAWGIILSPYPVTVFMAGCIACLTLPLYRWLRARLSRAVSVLAYALGLALCLFTPFAVVSILVAPQVVTGVQRLNEWRASGWAISPELQSFIAQIEGWIARIPLANNWLTELMDNIDAIANEAVRSAVSGGIGFAGSTVSALWEVFLFVVLAVLAVIYAPALGKVTLRVTSLPEDSFQRFVQAMRSALRAVFAGILFVALVQGTLCGIGFRIFGVHDPAFWGLLATFMAVIPVVGTALIWVPMVIILWFQGSTFGALGLVAWCMFIVANSDNLLRPYLLKTGIDASMVVLLLSILCSMTVFGPVGLVAGPVLVAFGIWAMKESDILQKRQASAN